MKNKYIIGLSNIFLALALLIVLYACEDSLGIESNYKKIPKVIDTIKPIDTTKTVRFSPDSVSIFFVESLFYSDTTKPPEIVGIDFINSISKIIIDTSFSDNQPRVWLEFAGANVYGDIYYASVVKRNLYIKNLYFKLDSCKPVKYYMVDDIGGQHYIDLKLRKISGQYTLSYTGSELDTEPMAFITYDRDRRHIEIQLSVIIPQQDTFILSYFVNGYINIYW